MASQQQHQEQQTPDMSQGAQTPPSIEPEVALLLTNEEALCEKAISLLLKICSSIVQQPHEKRVRSLNLSSRAVEFTLLPAIGAIELLFFMGFQEANDRLVMPENASLDTLRMYQEQLQLLLSWKTSTTPSLGQAPSISASLHSLCPSSNNSSPASLRSNPGGGGGGHSPSRNERKRMNSGGSVSSSSGATNKDPSPSRGMSRAVTGANKASSCSPKIPGKHSSASLVSPGKSQQQSPSAKSTLMSNTKSKVLQSSSSQAVSSAPSKNPILKTLSNANSKMNAMHKLSNKKEPNANTKVIPKSSNVVSCSKESDNKNHSVLTNGIASPKSTIISSKAIPSKPSKPLTSSSSLSTSKLNSSPSINTDKTSLVSGSVKSTSVGVNNATSNSSSSSQSATSASTVSDVSGSGSSSTPSSIVASLGGVGGAAAAAATGGSGVVACSTGATNKKIAPYKLKPTLKWLGRYTGYLQRVLTYEDPVHQAKARALIPVARLHIQAMHRLKEETARHKQDAAGRQEDYCKAEGHVVGAATAEAGAACAAAAGAVTRPSNSCAIASPTAARRDTTTVVTATADDTAAGAIAVDSVVVQGAKQKLGSSVKENKNTAKPFDFNDHLLVELTLWFKQDFFRWFDCGWCSECRCNMASKGSVPPTKHELEGEANNVEYYQCQMCGRERRFPRYLNVGRLLETREGRCGEWASCFTLCCRTLGFDARQVFDETDHTWTEVWSHSQSRWVHADPCEGRVDCPLLYECGWGKQLSYVVATSRDEVMDVTWRYTLQPLEVKKRRNKVSEEELWQHLWGLTVQLQQQHQQHTRHTLHLRMVREMASFLTPTRAPTKDELEGRSSGSLGWRVSRGETGMLQTPSHHTFILHHTARITTLTVKYNPVRDVYSCEGVVGPPELRGWQAGVHSAANLAMKREHDWHTVYIARTEGETGARVGEAVWRVHWESARVSLDALHVVLRHTVFHSGTVTWGVTVNGEHYRGDQSGELHLTNLCSKAANKAAAAAAAGLHRADSCLSANANKPDGNANKKISDASEGDRKGNIASKSSSGVDAKNANKVDGKKQQQQCADKSGKSDMKKTNKNDAAAEKSQPNKAGKGSDGSRFSLSSSSKNRDVSPQTTTGKGRGSSKSPARPTLAAGAAAPKGKSSASPSRPRGDSSDNKNKNAARSGSSGGAPAAGGALDNKRTGSPRVSDNTTSSSSGCGGVGLLAGEAGLTNNNPSIAVINNNSTRADGTNSSNNNSNSGELELRVVLEGGDGSNAWQHAQLFRLQDNETTAVPFLIDLQFQ